MRFNTPVFLITKKAPAYIARAFLFNSILLITFVLR